MTREGLNTKVHAVCDALSNPVAGRARIRIAPHALPGISQNEPQHVVTGVAMNVKRVTACLTGQPREKTRTSRFARLAS